MDACIDSTLNPRPLITVTSPTYRSTGASCSGFGGLGLEDLLVSAGIVCYLVSHAPDSEQNLDIHGLHYHDFQVRPNVLQWPTEVTSAEFRQLRPKLQVVEKSPVEIGQMCKCMTCTPGFSRDCSFMLLDESREHVSHEAFGSRSATLSRTRRVRAAAGGCRSCADGG